MLKFHGAMKFTCNYLCVLLLKSDKDRLVCSVFGSAVYFFTKQ